MCLAVRRSYCRAPDVTLGAVRWFSCFTPACYLSFPHRQADDKERNAADSGGLWSGESEGDRGGSSPDSMIHPLLSPLFVCVCVCVCVTTRHMAWHADGAGEEHSGKAGDG